MPERRIPAFNPVFTCRLSACKALGIAGITSGMITLYIQDMLCIFDIPGMKSVCGYLIRKVKQNRPVAVYTGRHILNIIVMKKVLIVLAAIWALGIAGALLAYSH